MTELVRIKDGVALLDPFTDQSIAEFERQAKRIKNMQDALKASILREMQEKGIVKIDTDEITLTYIAPTMSESLDSKLLKRELPDIYDHYVRLVPRSESLRVKIK